MHTLLECMHFSHFKIFHHHLFLYNQHRQWYLHCALHLQKLFEHINNIPTSSHSWHQFRFFSNHFSENLFGLPGNMFQNKTAVIFFQDM